MSSPELTSFEAKAADWQLVLDALPLDVLVGSAQQTDVTDDGIIHVIETPEGLEGDAAIVDMSAIPGPTDTPHFHINGEHEAHFPLQGSATMYAGSKAVALTVGMHFIVEPETSHFIIPEVAEEGYVAAVVSLPGYKPENQIAIDPASNNVPADFNAGAYWNVMADAS